MVGVRVLVSECPRASRGVGHPLRAMLSLTCVCRFAADVVHVHELMRIARFRLYEQPGGDLGARAALPVLCLFQSS